MKGMAAFGSVLVRTTVEGSGAKAVMPGTLREGGLLSLPSRSNEKTTSAEVSGEPSENATCGRSLKVNRRASSDDEYDSASDGTGVDMSPAANVSRVLYSALASIALVALNSR